MSENERVLVVDDDRTLADEFARALSSDYEVTTAYTFEQARESLAPEVDVVLLDRNLPDGTGDELLKEIRERDHDYQVAMVSGQPPSSDLDCDTYLTKPLAEVDAVRETVEDLLDNVSS